MKTINKFNSTRTSSLQKYYNMYNISNIKMINKPKIYHPINPSHPFKFDILNLKQISKRKNALLINNKPLKDLILKYNLDERKNSNENHDPNKYYFNKFKDEEKKYQLTIRAILKKDIDNFSKYFSERKSHKKKKKINLKINDNHIDNNIRFYTSYSQLSTMNSKKAELLKDKGINQYIMKDSINMKRKRMKIKKLNLKSLGIKMKLSPKTNRFKFLKSYDGFDNKPIIIKKHLSFSVTNMKSSKLGRISIFAVFEEIGIHGKLICSALINYLIEYFQNSKEMNVCIERNNFYSILHWSFVNAQNYLINYQKKLNINLSNSGCLVCFIYLPKDNSNKIYCANSGLCKCLLYTNRGPDIFSVSSTIDRLSEKDRIYMFLRNKKLFKIMNDLNNIDKNKNEKIKTKNNDKEENINIMKVNNITNEELNIIDIDNDNKLNNDENDEDNINHDENTDRKEEVKENEKIEKIKINEEELNKEQDKSIKYLERLGYTRCFGNLSGKDYGLIPDPELIECDLKSNKVRYAVLGNYTFWKILNEPEIRFITSKYVLNKDSIAANKELADLIRQKLGINSKIIEKIGFEVIYFDTFF